MEVNLDDYDLGAVAGSFFNYTFKYIQKFEYKCSCLVSFISHILFVVAVHHGYRGDGQQLPHWTETVSLL